MTYEVEIVDLAPQPAVAVRGHVHADHIADFLGRAFGEAMAALQAQHVAVTGPPFARFHAAGDGHWEIEAGFPAAGPVQPEGEVEPVELPGGRVARTLHRGAYSDVGEAYEAVDAWLQEHHVTAHGQPWESYLDGPDVAQPRTELYVPCA